MANIYVNPTGDDGTGDGSSGNPYQHIHHAIDQLSGDGDVIICQDGTYDEEIARTISYSITIKSESENFENVIIKPLTLQTVNGFGTWLNPMGSTFVLQNLTILFKEDFYTGDQSNGNAVLWPTVQSDITLDYCFISGIKSGTYFQTVIRDYVTHNCSVSFYKCTIRNFDEVARDIDVISYDSIYENITTFLDGWSVVNWGSYTGDYNCFYNYSTLFDDVSGGSLNTNDITTDPAFTGTSDEATINQSSPCFDTGTTVLGHVTSYQGDAPDIGVYEVLLGETINVSETVTLSDSNDLNVSKETININETVTLSDTNEFITNSFDVQENLTLDDTLYTEINRIDIEDGLTLSDEIELSNQGTVEYASRILSRNPLLIVSDTNPAKITEIDISDPENPTWNVYTVVGCSNANNITYNSETGYLYVFCDDGQLSKILATNLNSQTVIDTLDTDNLVLADIYEDKFTNYAITNDSEGELIKIDESSFENISLDIRFLALQNEVVNLQINTVLASSVSTDIRFLKLNTTAIGLDIRFLKYSYDEISQNPIDYTDWIVKVNGTDLVPLDDIDLKSIVITHRENQQSTASFILHRKFDDLDRDHDGNSSQISNNNIVQIYIDGNLEFNGKVSNINPTSESENIILTALADEKTDKRDTKNIPLASVNEQIHLYHCLTQSISIDNPYVDSSAYELDSVYGSGSIDLNLKQPQYYKGVKYDRGTNIKQNVKRYISYIDWASSITNGSFIPKQNWDYFWTASIKYLSNGGVFGSISEISSRYIGTSMNPITSDVIELLTAYNRYQRVYEDDETSLGYSYLGSAPYASVSGPNGKLETVERWEDKGNGLYNVRDDYYNNLNIISKIADLEYQKLKNINGDILPITTATVSLTVDAYYFYNISLLNRLNITNTTVSDTYKNNNGFPLAVQSITITSSNMEVVLELSNQWSQKELDEIDTDYPDENSGQVTGYSNKIFSKYDIVSRTYVE